ncbi:MAG: mannosyltransferase family protein [Pseudoflavonifractor sp.]|nr:mannosyltransferase family protein [Pseudoflavonifractor sp.]
MAVLWNVAATLMFLLAAGALTLRWLASCGARVPAPFSDPLPVRRGERPARLSLWKIFAAALLFRFAVALGSLILYNTLSGTTLSLADLPQLWCRWDAPHYVRLAELGYGGYLEDGQPLFLVFFPLYVWLMRALMVVFGHAALAGMAVSFLSFAWGCVYLYRLGCEEYGPRTAWRSLLLLSLYPFSFFFVGIMTESLFFLTTTAGLYSIRRHAWGKAAIWGVLAALTRMQGVILIGAAVAELGSELRPLARTGPDRRRAFAELGKKLPLLCAPALGSLAYLALNASVTGDAFAFTRMQKHWSQGFRWFSEVLAYLARNAMTWPKISSRLEMWIPELLLFPVFALLLWKSWKKHRSMLTLYGFVYFILNYCLSWLLSAGRYLSCAVPCFLFAADELAGKPRRTAALLAGMAVLQAVFLYRYLCWGQVM